MCWCSKKAIKHIALEDVPTFKVGWRDAFGVILSYYQDFRYSLNITYELRSEIYVEHRTHGMFDVIDYGFHSYSDKCNVEYNSGIFVCSLNEGKSIDRYIGRYDNSRACIMKCIIPKGAEYYVNERGEYVSNKIRIIDVLDFENIKETYC